MNILSSANHLLALFCIVLSLELSRSEMKLILIETARNPTMACQRCDSVVDWMIRDLCGTYFYIVQVYCISFWVGIFGSRGMAEMVRSLETKYMQNEKFSFLTNVQTQL